MLCFCQQRSSWHRCSAAEHHDGKGGGQIPLRRRSRGILTDDNGQYDLLVRNSADYTRDDLIDSVISFMNGGWADREDAIRATAAHLGFQKAGSAFKEAMKSAINGAIRRGLLEHDGAMIRKT